ncbi:pilus assembly PilX family protein [Undibacterium fentianense]|uniref:Tfp pilus assembly protein PilX n=1 Tax=Undibacterium fentianense TaxID=2828728 RepID=A0A941E2D5_9BURK|nr:PilX N-terminal domain-containing pilus assembly protein [Undibacterium fentianense]MBR7801080.1 hypothetical protein [Undibacterium fentianense]
MKFKFHQKQRGFVLAVSMIFLIVMTMLAVTAIKKATLDEKVTANLRAQDLAFQAAEKALRFCESFIVLTVGALDMCKISDASPVKAIPSQKPANIADVTSNFPDEWTKAANWKGAGANNAVKLSEANSIVNVADQPQCMIERWEQPNDRGGEQFYPYVITARGVGSVDTAVVWLQEVIRCGNN